MSESKSFSGYERIKGFFSLTRLPNLAIIALILALLRYFVAGPLLYQDDPGFMPPEGVFILLALTIALLAAGGYVVNDYFDVRSDQVNDPDKLLVTRLFSVKQTIFIYRVITGLSLLLGLLLAWILNTLWFGLVFMSIAALFWFYSSLWKTYLVWKNLIVALLSAILFMVAWLFEFYHLRLHPVHFSSVIGSLKTVTTIYFTYAGFSFLYTLIREIIKDMEDIAGDEAAGIRTIPIVFGIRNTKIIVIVLTLVSVGFLAWIQAALFVNGMSWFFWYLLITVQLPALYMLLSVYRAQDKAGFREASSITKLIMVAGVVSIIFTTSNGIL
jgi:4-hydroxybenzoate polyprenyltransferase